MAKLEQVLSGDFYEVISEIEQGIINGSLSASLKDFSDFESGAARCSVRVYERFSYAEGKRVSLTITFFQNEDGPIQLSAIAAGGCEGMFFKGNAWGEKVFLEKLKEVLQSGKDRSLYENLSSDYFDNSITGKGGKKPFRMNIGSMFFKR